MNVLLLYYLIKTSHIFLIFQTLQYGFPNKPTALAWDPLLRIMAIGTSTGTIKVYPFFLKKIDN